MTDELKDIIYADLFRYTGNARRYKNIYACYLEERRSSPEFSYISVMRRTRYYADQVKKYDGIRKKIYQIKFGVSNYRLDRLSRKYHFQIPYDTDIGKGFYPFRPCHHPSEERHRPQRQRFNGCCHRHTVQRKEEGISPHRQLRLDRRKCSHSRQYQYRKQRPHSTRCVCQLRRTRRFYRNRQSRSHQKVTRRYAQLYQQYDPLRRI